MAETYCGKSCAQCTKRESSGCPGCMMGPGRSIGGDCELARCCRTRGHETCDTCVDRGNCWTLADRFSQPDKRLQKLQWEQQKKQERVKRSSVLGKWSWYLFWLIIATNVTSILSVEVLAERFPALDLAGLILKTVILVGYGLVLLKMGQEEQRFRTAAWCTLAVAAVQGILDLLVETESRPLLLTLPLAVVSLVGQYQEFQGFGDSLSGVDNDLARKWENLWKWSIGSLGVMMASVFLMLLIPVLGSLLILAAAIAQVVVSILQVIYIYRSAKAFTYYSA